MNEISSDRATGDAWTVAGGCRVGVRSSVADRIREPGADASE
jgi:hypothetical protein